MDDPKETPLDLDTPVDSAVPSTSRYLTRADVGTGGKNLTIQSFAKAEFPDAIKTVMHFTSGKPMVVNKTNFNRLKAILGGETLRAFVGKTVNVFDDPLIEMGGKIVGGIRIRQAGGADPVQDAIANAQTTQQAGDPNDEIPF